MMRCLVFIQCRGHAQLECELVGYVASLGERGSRLLLGGGADGIDQNGRVFPARFEEAASRVVCVKD